MPNTGVVKPSSEINMPENKGVGRILHALHRFEDTLLIGMFLGMLGMAVLQIFLREVLSIGIAWGDVLVRILVLWICLFGAMIATRLDKHISIDVIARNLPDITRMIVKGSVRLVTAVVCGIMAWQGVRLVRLDFEFGTVAFAGVPAWLCEIIIPVGFAVMALRYVIISIYYFKRISKRPS